MFLPVGEIHCALHFILTFFAFRAEARPISVARQTGWRRSLRFGSRHLRQSSMLRPLVAQIYISSVRGVHYSISFSFWWITLLTDDFF
jgi:hypothetical protein